ncbi:UNVERIFIED_CONTAM: hypothetical protein LK11_09970 [Mumia flava]
MEVATERRTGPAQVVARELMAAQSAWPRALTGLAPVLLVLVAFVAGISSALPATPYDGAAVSAAAWVAPALVVVQAMLAALWPVTALATPSRPYGGSVHGGGLGPAYGSSNGSVPPVGGHRTTLQATPLRTVDLAVADLALGALRAFLGGAVVLAAAVALGAVDAVRALVAVPALMLVAFVAGGVAAAVVAWVRTENAARGVRLVVLALAVLGVAGPGALPSLLSAAAALSPVGWAVELVRTACLAAPPDLADVVAIVWLVGGLLVVGIAGTVAGAVRHGGRPR